MKIRFLVSLAFIVVLFVGCSEGDSSSSDSVQQIKEAYLIDSAVSGVSYTTNKGDSGTTDNEGKFIYTEGSEVTFSIGGVEVGSLTNINSDGKAFIQDIVGVSRDDTSNSEVLKIARFLQSLDSDGDPSNGILISETIRESLKNEKKVLKNITLTEVETLITSNTSKEFRSEASAKSHMESVLVDMGIIDRENVQGNIESKYYGKWIYIHNGNILNILSTTNLSGFEAIDDNLIKITENGTVYSLMRSSIANIRVSGKIDSNNTSNSRDISDIGDIDVILQNILDPNIKAEVKTDVSGNFSDNTLPTGTYTLTAKDETKELNTTVEIVNENENLGIFKLTGNDIHNFKAELILDDEFVYGDTTTYDGKIRIHNISESVTGLGLSYEINATDTYLQQFNADIVSALGSILPKSYKDIPISFKFNPFFENERNIPVDVKIKDANGNQWYDTFTFNVYKGTFDINVDTSVSSIKGYIVLPNTHSVKNINISSGKITLPLLKDKQYHLVLSNPNINEETAYSIGIDIPTQGLSNFTDTSAHEQNNKETDAQTISIGDSIVSYLHMSDIDFWKISTPQTNILLINNEGTYTAKVDALLGEEVTSNPITISSVAEGTTLNASVDNGTIVKNGTDAGTSTTVTNGDTVAIKISASNLFSTGVSSTLTMGTITRTYSVTTKDSSDEGTYTAKVDALLGEEVTSNPITISSVAEGTTLNASVDNGTIVKNGTDAGTSTTVTNGDTVAIKISASNNINEKVSSNLSIANISKVYEITTLSSISTNFTSVENATTGNIYTSNSISLNNIIADGKYITISTSNAIILVNNVEQGSSASVTKTDSVALKVNFTGGLVYRYLSIGGIEKEYFISNGEFYVDNNSKIWQDDSNAQTNRLTRADAVNYCNNLDYLGQTDWRLPESGELQVLYGEKNNLVNAQADGYYWSNSTDVNNGVTVYGYIRWAYGDVKYRSDGNTYNVRCIKDK